VYRLTQEDRVEDAIRAAGGLAPNADGARLNLAQRVRDEQRLDVPTLPLLPGVPASSQAAASQGVPSAVVPLAGDVDTAAGATPAGVSPTQVTQAPATTSVPAAGQGVQPSGVVRPTNTPRAAATARPTAFSGGRVNVNTATQAQLEQLPGFGEVSAKRIVDYRAANGPLRSIDDVRKAGVTATLANRAAAYLSFE